MVRGRPIVKIFLTCNDILVGRLVKANPKTALIAWSFLEQIFLDNKRTKTIALRGELQVLDMGDMIVDSYFAKIESIATLLSDLGSPMHDKRPYHVSHSWLSDWFAHVSGIIAHRVPFPDLYTIRSMVTIEDLRLKHKTNPSVSLNTSLAPHVLLAESSTSQHRDTRPYVTKDVTRGCHGSRDTYGYLLHSVNFLKKS
ncbi:hypothetical protein Tco_0831700 [Tanacetum coccineum]